MCQDRNIRLYSVAGAKQTKTFKGSASEDGTLIKVVLDGSGIYCATSCTDKTLAIYDYHTGELMASMAGHSELVTGLAFSPDCRHLISVSGDSCIFVWRLPGKMVATMQARLAASPNKNASRTYITSPLGMEEDFSDLTEVFTWTLEDPRQMEGPLPIHDFPINRTEARFVQFEILSSFGNQGGLMYFAALEGRLTILYNFKL